ncbi:hypothetical protein [Roseisolibacter sp. H3M3-2]|uniref:hypothetical protein n=1 Tax=Roseisolibacter sp. H3M3-2 TaxID=3031323 RepID=UPI0023DC3978|nr:hypothetical protein [Roseisolibacter sp. H3M3-2]MDF1506304.1 hypothetical protein [Roseisolibacter sp. H3M3-2]
MPEAPVSAARELRRHLMVMVLGVVAVHAVALALYYALDVEQRPAAFRRVFTGVWTVATLPVVLIGLSRVRAARLRARHARRQQQGR